MLRGEAPPPPGPQQAHLFSQDLAALGHLLLALMCAGTVQTPSVEFAAQHFTRELVMLAVNLMEGPGERGINSAEQLVTAMAGRMCVEFGAVGVGLDRVLADLEARRARSKKTPQMRVRCSRSSGVTRPACAARSGSSRTGAWRGCWSSWVS